MISVLIPSYNHGRYIAEAVESVWRQAHRPLELVVVDDASSDDSHERLLALAARSPIPMRVERHAVNQGPGATLRHAYELSRGELVAFLASDDTFVERRFEPQVEALRRHPDVGVVYGDGEVVGADGRATRRVHGPDARQLLARPPAEVLSYLYEHKNPIFIQGCLVRRELVADAFVPGLLADDWVVNIRIFEKLARGGRHLYLDEVLFRYRQHDTNVHRDLGRQLRLKEQVIQTCVPEQRRRTALARVYYEHALKLRRTSLREALAFMRRSSRLDFSLLRWARFAIRLC